MSDTRTNDYTTWVGRLWSRLFMLVVLSFGAIGGAQAANPLNLVDGTEAYPAGMHLSYFEDVDGRVTLQDILSGESGHSFTPSQKEVPSLSFTASVYWFQLDLINQSSPIAHWLLESQYPLLDRINVYLVYPDERVVTYRGGDKLPFEQRAVKHQNVMFKVPLAMGERVRIFMKVRTESSMQLPLVLRSPDSLLKKDHEEQLIVGIYYGILLAMLLYNLLIFAAIRDITYLYYVSYLVTWILFQMSISGLAFEYLWPDNPSWGNKATPFFLACANLGGILFARSLLQTKVNTPTFNRLLQFASAFCVVIALLALFASYTIAIKIGTVVSLMVVMLVVSTGIWSLKIGLRQARYFLLAWSALLLGITLYVLKTFGVIPSTIVTEYCLQIGATFEVILLSFALAHRMRILKEDNERMLAETAETLERRVQERTQELDEALLGLSHANNKLQEINHTDGLTGISNRAYFNEEFEFEWQRAMRTRSPIGLLMLDIDHFKRFNDTYGHLVGDACLKLVAQTIKRMINRPADRCYRYGGEEFAVVLPHTDHAGSLFIAETICRAIEALEFTFEGRHIPITISIGVCSMLPERDAPHEILISQADQALYQAKREGRNRVNGFLAPPPSTPAS